MLRFYLPSLIGHISRLSFHMLSDWQKTEHSENTTTVAVSWTDRAEPLNHAWIERRVVCPPFSGISADSCFYPVTAFLGLGIPNLTRVELPTLPLLSVVRLSHRESNRTDTRDWAALALSLFLNMVTAGNPFGLCALVYKGSL